MASKRTGRLLSLLCLCFFILSFPSFLHAQTDPATDRIREIFEQGWALESRMHVDPAGLDRAITLYEEAVAIAPDNAEARWRLAEVTFKKSETIKNKEERTKLVDQSIALAEQALALNPESVGGMYWAGTALARKADMTGLFSAMKHVKQAKAYLHRAIGTDPDHRLSVLSGTVLALIYCELPWPMKDMDQALELARWSVQKDPDLTIAALALGKIYLALGNINQSEQELKRCLGIRKPTYIWDAELYDWPETKKTLAAIRERK